MKRILALTIIFFLTACGSPAPTAETTSTPLPPTNTAIPTHAPTSTITPTATLMPTPTLTPTLAAPAQLAFELGDGVEMDDFPELLEGFGIAHKFIQDIFGEDITLNEPLRVKIEATGRGNLEVGAGGSCCTALDIFGARIYFDLLHPEFDIEESPWDWSIEDNKKKVAVHEYTHAWQYALGCITINRQPLPFWFNEGLAEYFAYTAMEYAMPREEVFQLQMLSSINTGQADIPLKYLVNGTHVWPGHKGYFAIDYLVNELGYGLETFKTICELAKTNGSFRNVFEETYGLPVDQFFEDFEIYFHDLPVKQVVIKDFNLDGSNPQEPPTPVALENTKPENIIIRDEFNQSLLRDWKWEHQARSTWTVTGDGWLQIIGGDTSLLLDGEQENLLTYPLPDGDFVITLHMQAKPTENFQNAGIYLFTDPDNYLTLIRGYCESCINEGSGIFLDNNYNGELSGFNAKIGAEDFYLRLVSQGGVITGYYALEADQWVLLGEFDEFYPFEKVAFGATSATGSKTLEGWFDYIEIGIP